MRMHNKPLARERDQNHLLVISKNHKYRVKDANLEDLEEEYPFLVSTLENLLALDRDKITAVFHQAKEEGKRA